MQNKMIGVLQRYIFGGVLFTLLLLLVMGNRPVYAEEFRYNSFPGEETLSSEVQLGNLNYVTIQDEEHRFSENTLEHFTEILTISYPKICEEFNDGEILPVTICAESISDHPADTSGTLIRMDPDYFNTNNDYDALTHELVHVAQQGSYMINQADLWIIEGTADYGRDKYGLYSKESGFSLPSTPSIDRDYNEGYREAAAFLKWIEDTKKPNFVKDLNKAIQMQTYSTEYFQNITGMDVDELWENYLADYNIYYPDVDISVPQSTPIPTNTDIASYLTIDNKGNSLSSAEVAKIRSLFVAVYGKICEAYNYGTLFPVTIVSDPEYKDLAYTDSKEHKVVINPNYYHEHPNDYDSITHELVHVAQNYSGNVPVWITEGIADYGRNEFGINNEAAGWMLQIVAENPSKPTSGYTDTAAFFLWIEKNYHVKVSEILNAVCKKDAYNPSVWKKMTGSTLWSLKSAYYKEFKAPVRALKQGDSFTDAVYVDEDGNRVALSKYVGKPTLVIFNRWDNMTTKSPIEQAVFYKKTLGDDIHVLVVCLAQYISVGKKIILEQTDFTEKDLSDIVFLSDPNMTTTFLKFAKLDEDGGGAVFGAPNAVMIDKDGMLVYGEYQGDRYLSESEAEGMVPFAMVFHDLYELFPEKREELLKGAPDEVLFGITYQINGAENPREMYFEYEEDRSYQIIIISNYGRHDNLSYSSSNPKVIKAEPDIGNGECGRFTLTGIGQADVTICLSNHNMVRNYVIHITVEKSSITDEKNQSKTGSDDLTEKDQRESDSDNVGRIFTSKGFKIHILNKSEASILGPVSKKKTSYVIPDQIKTGGKIYKVTRIDPKAFKGCNKLKKVKIGKNVRTIGKNAFSGCIKLKNIWINCPQIKKVPKKAFKNISKKAVFHLASRKQ